VKPPPNRVAQICNLRYWPRNKNHVQMHPRKQAGTAFLMDNRRRQEQCRSHEKSRSAAPRRTLTVKRHYTNGSKNIHQACSVAPALARQRERCCVHRRCSAAFVRRDWRIFAGALDFPGRPVAPLVASKAMTIVSGRKLKNVDCHFARSGGCGNRLSVLP